MYSRRKGKSGSKRPLVSVKPTWVRYEGKELEMLIVKLAKEGKSSAEIGLALRDVYGVPDVRPILGKRITEVLSEKKLLGDLPEDLMALMKRSVLIRKHLESNRKDMPALRGLQLTEAKIKRLVKYYKRTNKLPVSWKFDVSSMKLLAE